MQIETVRCLKDNYAYILHDPSTGTTAVVDPSEAKPVLEKLRERNWRLNYVLNTHHHLDHVGGNEELKATTGCAVICSAYDEDRIAGVTDSLQEGVRWKFGKYSAEVMEIPGHTLGHIALYFPSAGVVFTGDTLFSLGCGRLFEGTPAQMWGSLSRLSRLPEDTLIFCGHEYTFAHSRFALTIEPENSDLQERVRAVLDLTAAGKPTIPVRLGEELATNPFLRPLSPEIRTRLGLELATDLGVFTELRKLKDNFA